MDRKIKLERIHAQSDDNPNVHAIIKTGEDDDREYHLVVAEKQHSGRQMLKIRYFAYSKTDESQDTWMKNGITARTSDELNTKLANIFGAVAKGNLPDSAFMTGDVSDTIED